MTDQLKRAISAAKTAQTTAEQTDSIGIASSSAGDQNFDMSESSYKTSHTAIRKARRFAMQGLYEWLVTDRRFDMTGKLGWKANAPHDIAARTRATNAMHTVHIGYYHEMMHDIPEQIEALDVLISQHLDREIDKLDTVEHAILLVGTYELQNRLEIPYKVVLDEAMKLNNHFGATDAHKLINAVLDRMAIELRAAEVQADIHANRRTSQKVVAKQPDATPVESAETDSDIHMDDAPTASSKPRISANSAPIKRNRPNKTNAGISIKAVAESSRAKEESTKTVASNKVDVAVNNEAVDDNSLNDLDSGHQSVDNVVNEDTITENVVVGDVESLSETKSDDVLEGDASNVKETDSIETSDSDSVSVETNSSEITSTETGSSQIKDSTVDSTDSTTTDAKSKD